jgi:hypothetical protein
LSTRFKGLSVVGYRVRRLRKLYKLNQIDTHSIRKGAASYLTSIPGKFKICFIFFHYFSNTFIFFKFSGGPSTASVCLRGGWSMGNVKDRYFKYSENGDQFVGRCIAMLPVLHVDFAISPPFLTSP